MNNETPDIRYAYSDITRKYERVLIISGPNKYGIYRIGFPYGNKTVASPPYHPCHENRFRIGYDIR